MKNAIRFIAMLSVAAFALSIPVGSAFAAGPPDSTTIPKLFDQVKHDAAQVIYDADVLESCRHSKFDWKTYAQVLTSVKEHANSLFRSYYQLQQMRDKGTPAQQKAIDQLEPLLRDMAASLTNTFQALKEHPDRVNMPSFRTRVHANWEKINAVYKLLCQCTSKNLLA